MGKLFSNGELVFEDFDDFNADYLHWLDVEYQNWKSEELRGFSCVGEYWEWVRMGDELGFLTERPETETVKDYDYDSVLYLYT